MVRTVMKRSWQREAVSLLETLEEGITHEAPSYADRRNREIGISFRTNVIWSGKTTYMAVKRNVSGASERRDRTYYR